MKKKIFIGGVILTLGVLAFIFAIPRTVTLVVNGQSRVTKTNSITARGALRDSGFQLSPDDRVNPRLEMWLRPGTVIQLDQAQTVTILVDPDGESHDLHSASRLPADLLAQAGITLGENDRLTFNGQTIPLDHALPYQGSLLLEVHKAVAIEVTEDGQPKTLLSTAGTLGQALWQWGITLSLADRISLPLDTPLDEPLKIEIQRALPVTIQVDNQEIIAPSAAETVAGALSEAGVSLQGRDYSLPSEDASLPADRLIRVVRVKEEVILTQKPLPYKSSYQPDPNTELDKRSVVSAGEYGLQVSRERVIYEDGVEVSRAQEDSWVAKESRDQVLGYGTLPVVKTIDTPSGTLEYWRAVNVYATSYSPCRLGIPNYCNSQTASGLTVRQGIIAVTRAWYSWMVGQKVYIPGYGVAIIADVGGGIPGRYWIDLAYNDADYVPWSRTVTMYFLNPVPANFPWILP